MYASSNDNVGVDEGSNTVTLTEDNLPAHTHTRGTMNITGDINVTTTWNETDDPNWANGAFFVKEKFPFTVSRWNGDCQCGMASLDASKNWTGETSSFGKASPDAIDVKGAVRRVYIYYRNS